MKLAAGGPAAGGAVVKVDNVAAKRRPKSTKRKKPSDTGALPPQTRLETPKSQDCGGVKLETGSMGGGDDSGINMSETWQRNGHSADFIRQSIGQFCSTSFPLPWAAALFVM